MTAEYMTAEKQNPGVQAGVSLDGHSHVSVPHPTTAPRLVQIGVGRIEQPFQHHRQAALALLAQCPDLSHKAAGFLGHVCVAEVLSTKQREWLIKLLARNGQPPLFHGGGA